jgi:hypothetical protein
LVDEGDELIERQLGFRPTPQHRFEENAFVLPFYPAAAQGVAPQLGKHRGSGSYEKDNQDEVKAIRK